MSAQIITQGLRKEASKYVDIMNVLGKLQENGQIDNISNIFLDIFKAQRNFTSNELKRIMKSLNTKEQKTIDFQQQFEINTSIFKNNFSLLVQLLIDQIWTQLEEDDINLVDNLEDGEIRTNNHLRENQDDNKDSSTNENKTAQNNRSDNLSNFNGSPQQNEISQLGNQSVISNINNNSSSSFNNKSNLRESLSVNEMEGYKTITKTYDKWIQKNQQDRERVSSPNSASKLDISGDHHKSNISAILSPVNSANNLSASKFMLASASNIQRANEILSNNLSLSISSVQSSGPNKFTAFQVPFSELQDNSMSFSRAERQTDFSIIEQRSPSPGPTDYNTGKGQNYLKKSSPNARFDRTQKETWIDQTLQTNISPGPKYTYTEKNISKPRNTSNSRATGGGTSNN